MPGEQEMTWTELRDSRARWIARAQSAESRVQELEGAARELVEAIDFPNIGIASARAEQTAVEKLRKLL